MLRHSLRMVIVVGWMVALAMAGGVWADQLVLKNGTILEGTIVPQADSYWIKLTDGQTQIVPMSEVKERVAAKGTSGGTAEPGTRGPAPAGNFATARRQAEAVEAPLAAVAIWQKFLESSPSESDKKLADAELEKWKKLADEGAEKIHGKWVGGEERKAIIAKAAALADEAMAIYKNQTLAAIRKLDEAAKIYPNSYRANFLLGYLHLIGHDEDTAIRLFEQGLRLRPDASESMNNLAVALVAKHDYVRSLTLMYRAAEKEDNKELAQNLVTVIAATPESLIRGNARLKPVIEAASLLATKYGIRGPAATLYLVPPKAEAGQADAELPAGVASSGSGFVLRDDGLILTNRHVVEGGRALLVLLPGNVRKSAEIVKIDEEQDLALIQVKPDLNEKLSVVGLSAIDAPNEGAQCFAMGYPLIDRMGATIKITQGIISGSTRSGVGADVLTDAKVNPGNSGGPLLDTHGLVIGIVTMKSLSSATEDSYGMAISAGRIRKFLDKNNVKLAAGAAADAVISAEQVVARAKPATVCILSVR